eukprot:gene11911-13877_t
MADEEVPSGPLEDRLSHKNWKWRSHAYEELANKFKTSLDSTGPLFNEYEADSPEPVNEALLKGATNTSPKILMASLIALRETLKTFGPKIVPIKPILKQYAPWFEHRDKNIRDEASSLLCEIYRWMGKPLLNLLEALTPLQIKALTDLFEKVPADPPAPLKYIRSEAAKAAAAAAKGAPAASAAAVVEEIDPYSMLDPVNILSKLDTEFYTGCDAKKWQERQAAIDRLVTVLQASPKIEAGDFGDITKILKRLLSDTNLMIATKAIIAVGLLCDGLRTGYASQCRGFVTPLTVYYKEKKPQVVPAVHATMDSIVTKCVGLPDILDDILAAMQSKVPQIKQEVLEFIYRTITNAKKPADITKISKQLAKMLMETLDDVAAPVRDGAAKAFASLGGIIGERGMAPYLSQLDPIKAKKIRDQMPAAPAPGAIAPPPPQAIEVVEETTTTTTGTKKTSTKRSSTAPQSDSSSSSSSTENSAELLKGLASPSTFESLGSANLKDRVKATDELIEAINNQSGDALTPLSDALINLLAEKPGWKEPNFQVSTNHLTIISRLAKKDPKLSKSSATSCVPHIIEKLTDVKLKESASECLFSLSEALGPQVIFASIYACATNNKNPKANETALVWVAQAIDEFGINHCLLKPVFDFVRAGLDATSTPVKTAAIRLACSLRLAIGPAVSDYFCDVKRQLYDAMEKEFAKIREQRPPNPVRTPSNPTEIPRTDISSKITGTMLGNLGDTDWKIRQAGLEEIIRVIIDGNRRVASKLGSLVPAVSKGTLADKNQKVLTTTLTLISLLAASTGTAFDKAAKTLLPGILALLADSKKPIRDAALSAMSTLADDLGLDAFVPSLAAPLSLESAVSRKEALAWTIAHMDLLKSTAELPLLARPIVLCLQDKNAEVRSLSETLISHIYPYITADQFKREQRDVKSANLGAIQVVLDKFYKKGANPPPPPSRKPVPVAAPAATVVEEPVVRPRSPVRGARAPQSPNVTTTTSTSGLTRTGFITGDQASKIARQRATTGAWYFHEAEEIYEQLQEMVLTVVSEEFANMMFSANPTHSQAVVDALIDALDTDVDGVLAIIDVLFRWISLKLFDMGLSSLKRTLKLLEAVLTRLHTLEYTMSDYEASCIVPTVSEKMGSSNETFKTGTKTCYRAFADVCPPPVLFKYTLEATRSGNWRTRMETVTELGLIINQHGGAAAGSPTALKTVVPAIARILNDREPTAKQAAIYTLTQLYSHIGEDIWKYLGNVSSQDRALLQANFSVESPASKETTRRSVGAPAKQQQIVHAQDEETNRIVEILDILSNFNPSDIDIVVEQLKQVSGFLSSPSATFIERFVPYTEGYLCALTDILTTEFGQVFADPSVFRLCKYLIYTIINVYSSETVARAASVSVLMRVLTAAIRLLVGHPEAPPTQAAELEWVTKALNQVLLRTLQNSANTTLFCALLKMITASKKDSSWPHADKYNDLLLRCLLRAIKSLKAASKDAATDLDITLVLQEINSFLVDNAPVTELNEKTIKTLTLELKNISMPDIIAFCKKVVSSNQISKYLPLFSLLTDLVGGKAEFERPSPPVQSPALQSTTTTTTTKTSTSQPLSDLEMGKLGVAPLATPEALNPSNNLTIPKLPNNTANKTTSQVDAQLQAVNKEPRNFKCKTPSEQKILLADIFKKVGNKDLTMEGLYDLHYFRVQYPDYDISHNISQTAGPFQSYISRNLQKIAQTLEAPKEVPAEDVVNYSEKLKEIQHAFLVQHRGDNSVSDSVDQSTTSALNTLQRIRGLSTGGGDSAPISTPAGGERDLTTTVAALRIRLAQIQENSSKSNE